MKNDNKSKLITVRGVEVMLDRDVAIALVTTASALNKNAKDSTKWEFLRKENLEHEFRFQLTEKEVNDNILKSLTFTGGMSVYSNTYPWVYTQDGCNYFGASMTTPAACAQAVKLAKVFSKAQRWFEENKRLSDENNRLLEEIKRLSLNNNIQKLNSIIESSKFLLSVPGYNPLAVSKYVEQAISDVNGVRISERSLLDVMAFLIEKGMTQEDARSARVQFGKILKKIYIKHHGEEPQKSQRFVDGAQRLCYSYSEEDRPLFEETWELLEE